MFNRKIARLAEEIIDHGYVPPTMRPAVWPVSRGGYPRPSHLRPEDCPGMQNRILLCAILNAKSALTEDCAFCAIVASSNRCPHHDLKSEDFMVDDATARRAAGATFPWSPAA